jgi:hypothetical protein
MKRLRLFITGCFFSQKEIECFQILMSKALTINEESRVYLANKEQISIFADCIAFEDVKLKLCIYFMYLFIGEFDFL